MTTTDSEAGRAAPEERAAAKASEGQSRLDAVIADAMAAFKVQQRADGHWLYELEADVTIPAEYIMLLHFLDERNPQLEEKIARYIRTIQQPGGGWPLFHDGAPNLSATIKGYYALKLVGDAPDSAHMIRARELILSMGGAARANVFTRIALALFAQVPWRAVPTMPVEIVLLPRWFPFHLNKVSYWSRTVITPLLIVQAYRPRARNPMNIDVRELFVTPPEKERNYYRDQTTPLAKLFLGLDKLLKWGEPMIPSAVRRKAVNWALEWFLRRLNGEDGLGAIYPAMANSLMALDVLGYPKDDPTRQIVKRSIDKLITEEVDGACYVQPCLSPVWDTCLGAHALLEAGEPGDGEPMRKALDWLVDLQILDVEGDWITRRPGLRPGGWAFQYRNDYYPDVDDTAVVGMAMHRADPERYREAISRAAEWVEGVQSRNGGFGAFDVDNTHHYLNHIPFADHGALLDPPEADVTGRCLSFLTQIGYPREHPTIQKGLRFLYREQEPDGSFYGRWGTNYIYGTWSALCAFNILGEDMSSGPMRRAVEWLKSKQREDGGWGEPGESYYRERLERAYNKVSTPSQTAWAVLALMAAGEIESSAVRRGVDYLLACPRVMGGAKWAEEEYTAVGFPRVFYLRYHGYSVYYPLWALARYRVLTEAKTERTPWGM
jgi:squalene-hopene/tetraprenyl-beta-curcumene cyclase